MCHSSYVSFIRCFINPMCHSSNVSFIQCFIHPMFNSSNVPFSISDSWNLIKYKFLGVFALHITVCGRLFSSSKVFWTNLVGTCRPLKCSTFNFFATPGFLVQLRSLNRIFLKAFLPWPRR